MHGKLQLIYNQYFVESLLRSMVGRLCCYAEGGQNPLKICSDTIIDFIALAGSLEPWLQTNDFGQPPYRNKNSNSACNPTTDHKNNRVIAVFVFGSLFSG